MNAKKYTINISVEVLDIDDARVMVYDVVHFIEAGVVKGESKRNERSCLWHVNFEDVEF